MESSVGLQVWAARLCLTAVVVLGWAGMYFENIRFIAPAAGFLILAVVCYVHRPVTAEPARRLSHSGQWPAL
jgi:hypothetical protein